MEFTAAQPEVSDWSESVQVPAVSIRRLSVRTGVYSQPLGADQQLPQRRLPRELEPPLSGPELLFGQREGKGGRKIQFLNTIS